ncbi:Retrovirus-related Pol polyprotein from transposon RE1 [Vitis vinifera]|uniref:Retrovirus-related Pol polyprotein from transposon RE1 n=1 Tax=Vitis vinifera TaxID=29760 RepID=A0A438GNW4_VITVI|nr:Retrovirus-related Pol polyprotein from transposon RE1 [Vitis vinifera]
MSTTTKLSKDASGKDVEQKLYRRMVGSLLYLTTSHPDISFSVEAYARYQANPKESHLMSVKGIICYINGTLDYGLWYPYGSSLVIDGYSDIDWAINVDDRKNASSACFFFIGDCLMAWLSKKQNFISLSTVEAEYIFVGS